MKLWLILVAVLVLVGCKSKVQLPDLHLSAMAGGSDAPGDIYQDNEIDLAPFFQVEDDEDHSRTRLFGPFIEEHQDADGRRSMALRPLFSRYEDFSREHIAQDILYPLLTYRLNAIRLLQNGFIGLSIDDNIHDPESPWQSYILPVYFNGRGKDGDRYFALWPLGGTMRDIFTYKFIQFWLWPLYMKTVKSNDIISYHALWPIFHKADGKYIKKRKVFPIAGYSEDYKRQWNTSFFLWPLFHWGYSLDKEKQQGWAFGLFPLISYATLSVPEKNYSFYSWNFLFPFFMHAISENATKIHAPWPFFQYMKQTDPKTGRITGSRLWFWPFWGKDLKRGSKELFVMYPLFFKYDRPIPGGRRKMTYTLIAFMNTEDRKDNGEWSKFSRLWPLASYARDSKGNRNFKVFDVFPLRNIHAIDRNWAPIWTLYHYRATKQWFSHELLWGLVQFKKQRGGNVLDCSIFPFFNYEISGLNKIKKFNVLLGLYGSKFYTNGAKDSRYLWLWSQRTKDGKLIGHGLFPFYSRMKGAEGPSRRFSLLGGLWGKETKDDGSRRTRFLWFFNVNHTKPPLKDE